MQNSDNLTNKVLLIQIDVTKTYISIGIKWVEDPPVVLMVAFDDESFSFLQRNIEILIYQCKDSNVVLLAVSALTRVRPIFSKLLCKPVTSFEDFIAELSQLSNYSISATSI